MNKNNSQESGINPEEWIDRYGDLLYSYAFSRTKDAHLAEEVVQETLARGVRKLASFNGKSNVKTWLLGILKNVLRENARKSKPSNYFQEEDYDWDISAGAGNITALRALTPIEVVQRIEFWEVVETCLNKLPVSLAEVFREKEIEGKSTDEVAESKGISEGNVWTRIHRARKFMQDCLKDMLKLGGKNKR